LIARFLNLKWKEQVQQITHSRLTNQLTSTSKSQFWKKNSIRQYWQRSFMFCDMRYTKIVSTYITYLHDVCLFVVFFTAQQHTRAIIVPNKFFMVNEINYPDEKNVQIQWIKLDCRPSFKKQFYSDMYRYLHEERNSLNTINSMVYVAVLTDDKQLIKSVSMLAKEHDYNA